MAHNEILNQERKYLKWLMMKVTLLTVIKVKKRMIRKVRRTTLIFSPKKRTSGGKIWNFNQKDSLKNRDNQCKNGLQILYHIKMLQKLTILSKNNLQRQLIQFCRIRRPSWTISTHFQMLITICQAAQDCQVKAPAHF